MPVGSVGLAVTQSNALTTMLQHGARMLVEFLAQLTSVERILEYSRIETEKNLFDGRKYELRVRVSTATASSFYFLLNFVLAIVS